LCNLNNLKLYIFFRLKYFFSCVNFGEKANKFLQSCGVKNEPTPVEYAELLVESSEKLWNLFGKDVKKYLFVLKRIAADFKYYHTIAKNSNLILRMKRKNILLAIKKQYSEEHAINKRVKNVGKAVNIYSLASAMNIFINDDIIYQQIFNPLTAPEEDSLEMLYKVCIKKLL
jgi:hypothetical protein